MLLSYLLSFISPLLDLFSHFLFPYICHHQAIRGMEIEKEDLLGAYRGVLQEKRSIESDLAALRLLSAHLTDLSLSHTSSLNHLLAISFFNSSIYIILPLSTPTQILRTKASAGILPSTASIAQVSPHALCGKAYYSTLQCGTEQCVTEQCGTVQCNIIVHLPVFLFIFTTSFYLYFHPHL